MAVYIHLLYFCICFDGVVIAAQCTLAFSDLMCSPNLGIRMWICQLNFAQRPIFQAWDSLTSLKFQTRDLQLKVRPGGHVFRIFTPWKNLLTSVGFEPVNLGSRGEHGTPRQTCIDLTKHLNWQCNISVFTCIAAFWFVHLCIYCDCSITKLPNHKRDKGR